MKKIIAFLLFLSIVATLISCEKEYSESTNIFANPHQLGQEKLYGEENIDFIFDKSVKDFDDVKLTEKLEEHVNIDMFSSDMLIEYENKNIFVAEHIDKKTGNAFQHIQVQYIDNDDIYFIFSAYEVNLNEMPNIIDYFGNEITNYDMKDLDVIEIIRTTPEALTQYYYYLSEENNEIALVATAGNELIAFHDGVLFHAMYSTQYHSDQILEYFVSIVDITQ